MTDLPPSVDAELEAALNARFPEAFVGVRGRRTKPMGALVSEWGPLTEQHVVAAREHIDNGATLGVRPPDLKAIRHTHHRLAQLLAVGVDETVAAKLCNYSVSRVSILKNDPAFRELMAGYAGSVQDQWADFVSTAANLSLDVLQELQRRLDENPEQFTVASLNETAKTLADRSGNAPVTKNLNLNVNADLADKMQAARARLRAASGG